MRLAALASRAMRVGRWMLCGVCAVAPALPCAAKSTDRSLVPSIFAPESTPAHSINQLAVFSLAVSGAIFLVVFGLIAYASIRYRRRRDDDGVEPAQVYGSNPVEVAWTTVPILIVVVLSLSTARVVQDVQNEPKSSDAVEVRAIGHQWWWEFSYPQYGIVTANELHVPVGKMTSIELQSADVVHSFWVPRLAGKTDLIPNRVNEMWIEPQRAGLFVGQCAEYCGTQHAKMLLRVYVHSRADFDKWVREQQASAARAPEASRGRGMFERIACVNCHTIRGTPANGRFGPDLTHLMSRETIGAGAAPNTPENLRAWIRSPSHDKPGALMPAMNVTDVELDQVVDYLITLK